MIIVIGIGHARTRPTGFAALHCPSCACARAFILSDVVEAVSVAGLELHGKKVSEAGTCTFCGASTLSVDAYAQKVKEWRPAQGLEDLRERTNPRLSRGNDELTDRQLGLLLANAKTHGRMLSANSGAGMLVGIFGLPWLLTPAVLWLRTHLGLLEGLDPVKVGGLTALAAALLGAFIGGAVAGRLRGRRLTEGFLGRALWFNPLPPDRLEAFALAQGAASLVPRIRAAASRGAPDEFASA